MTHVSTIPRPVCWVGRREQRGKVHRPMQHTVSSPGCRMVRDDPWMLDEEQRRLLWCHVVSSMTDHAACLYISDAIEQPVTTAPRRRDPPFTRAVAQDADQVPCGARREIARQIAKEAGRQHS